MRLGLGDGCGDVTAGPSEVLLSQPELSPQLVGIPFGEPGALAVEGGGSLGRLERGGHGRELVRAGPRLRQPDLDPLVVGQPNRLLGLLQRLVELLDLELEVAARSDDTKECEKQNITVFMLGFFSTLAGR